jgi:uncharacterized protein
MRGSTLDVRVLLRVHLQPGNLASMETLMAELLGEFSADPRFDAFFKPVGNWGGPQAGTFATLEATEGADLVRALQQRWTSARNGPGETPGKVAPAPYVCYAARPNSLVIRADGSIGKCTVLLKDARNKIGTLRPDGTLELISGRLTPWLRGFQSLDEEVLACPAHRLPPSPDERLAILGA